MILRATGGKLIVRNEVGEFENIADEEITAVATGGDADEALGEFLALASLPMILVGILFVLSEDDVRQMLQDLDERLQGERDDGVTDLVDDTTS